MKKLLLLVVSLPILSFGQIQSCFKDFNDGSTTSGGWGSFWTGTNTSGTNWGEWEIFGGNVAAASNFEFASFTNYACDSWMVSPTVDLSAISAPYLSFDNVTRYAGPSLELYVSTDYDGSSDPALQGTWMNISSLVPNWDTDSGDWAFVSSGNVDLTPYISTNTNIAFKYIGTNSDGATWELDNIFIGNCSSLGNQTTINEVLCDTSYNWDNQNYNQSGTYVNTYINIHGCDSTVTLNLTLNNNHFQPDFTVNTNSLTAPPFVIEFTNITPSSTNYDFTWDFGDGTVLQNNNILVFHEYQFNGLYDITLIAEDLTALCADTMYKSGFIFCTGGFNDTTSNLIVQKIINRINLYPNPTNGWVTFSLSNATNGQVILTDVLGKEVLSKSFTSNVVQLNLKSLESKGTYFAKVLDSNGNVIAIKKLIYQ